MRITYVYGVFWNNDLLKPMWSLTRNKRVAIQSAKNVNGQVFRVSYSKRDVWDAPTFRAVGEQIYPVPTENTQHKFMASIEDPVYCAICGASETEHQL